MQIRSQIATLQRQQGISEGIVMGKIRRSKKFEERLRRYVRKMTDIDLKIHELESGQPYAAESGETITCELGDHEVLRVFVFGIRYDTSEPRTKVGCAACVGKLNLWCASHENVLATWDDRTRTCFKCAAELAKGITDGSGILQQLRVNLRWSDAIALDAWLRTLARHTGRSDDVCLVEALAVASRRRGIPPSAVLDSMLEARSVEAIMPMPLWSPKPAG